MRLDVARRIESRMAAAIVIAAWTTVSIAQDDLLRTINAIRVGGCDGREGTAVQLQRDGGLDAVAHRMSKGGRLAAAVAAEHYAGRRAASITVHPGSSSNSVESLLRTRHCDAVTDPEFTRIGLAYDDDAAWIVLAAPFVAPEARSAGAVDGRVLQLVNEARSKSRRCGLRRFDAAVPVQLDPVLTRAAVAHAEDMAQHSSMSHEGSDGSSVADRVRREGYQWRFVAENVAAGQETADEVVATWLESSGHCANLMNPDMREMGIALAFDAASSAGTYWTQVFATRK
jgi:uncharacterized protein YkwD